MIQMRTITLGIFFGFTVPIILAGVIMMLVK